MAPFLLLLALAQPTADVVRPNDNLVAEGLPPIPTALAEEFGRYSEMRSASFLDWHPARREMLVSTRFGETSQVHRVTAPMGARRQLTFFRERVAWAGFVAGQRDTLLLSKDVGGNENFQLSRIDLERGAITLLTDGKSRNINAQLSDSGTRLVFGSNRRSADDIDLWLVDPRGDASGARLLAENKGGGFRALSWSPDEKRILVMEEVSVNESYLYLFDGTSGARELLTPKGGEKVAYGWAELGKDGKSLLYTSDEGSEFQLLRRMDLATKKSEILTPGLSWDVDLAALSHDGKLVAFVTNEEGVSRLRLLDLRTKKELPAPKLPVGVIGALGFHRNNRDLGLTLETGRFPADAYSLDVRTRNLTRWTESETGGLDTRGFSEAELIRWKSFDGRSISGFYYRAPARFAGKRPVMIEIHGGPEGQALPSFAGRRAYFTEELGVARILPNVRGSAGFGKTFLTLDNGLKREDSYKDIAALLDWIAEQPELDKDRIMVTGGSYGGFMTLAVATHYADRIRCALDVVGPSNLVTFLENTSGYRRDLRRVEYGDERDPATRAFLERIAPAKNAEKIKKPLFVVQGKNDPRVPASESEQMVATIRKNKTPVWYLLAKDEGHGFAKKQNVDFLLYSTAAFVKAHLLD